jgi:hypothetical protein
VHVFDKWLAAVPQAQLYAGGVTLSAMLGMLPACPLACEHPQFVTQLWWVVFPECNAADDMSLVLTTAASSILLAHTQSV